MSSQIPDEYAQFMEGSNNAFNFTGQLLSPSWSPGPTTVGSPLGVPPPDHIAGMDSGTSSSAAGANAYAAAVESRSPASHPILWAIIIMMGGVVLLGSVAHIEVKRRGGA